MPRNHLHRLLIMILAISILLVAGTVGYAALEGWSVLDSFFMTLITLSTVGYGETHDLTHGGRVFTSALIVLCVTGMTCWSAALTSFVVEGDLSGRYERRKMIKMISQLKGHTIVCGTGLTAQAVIGQLVGQTSVVVIGKDVEQLEQCKRRYANLLTISGNATDELTLAKANVLYASHVVIAMESEIDNLLVGITCKDVGENVMVHVQCNDRTIANRMRKAGIENVISPSQLCGDHVVKAIDEDTGRDSASPGMSELSLPTKRQM